MIKHGAELNVCEPECPLFHASRNSSPDKVEFLLLHGAANEINRKDSVKGTTALTEAIANGNAEIVEMLLDAGAKLTQDDERNDIVKACNSPYFEKVVAVLKRHHARISKDQLARYRKHGRQLDASEIECISGFLAD